MLELYQHNRIAYEAVLAQLERTGKAAVIHPTGTGKSFIAFHLAERFPKMRVLWLAPSEHIFSTQMENAKRAGFQSDNVSFMTYTKLMMLGADELDGLRPDCVVLDEFHRCGAERWGDSVEGLLEAYPNAWLLGLSATNVRYLDNQRDMAQEMFAGSVASEMTLGEAIVRGILPAPKYVTTVYRYQKDFERYQKRVNAARGRGIQDKNQAVLDQLRRRLEEAEGLDEVFARYIERRDGKYIVFCANIEHMREMRSHVKEWFGRIDREPTCYEVYSDHAGNRETFAAFRADGSEHLKLLFCIDMLNEGVHVEGISGVILFRPTTSPIIYKQQIGRALTAGSAAVPLVLDVVNNVENLFSISAVQSEMEGAVRFLRASGREDEIVTQRFEVYGEARDCRELFEQLESGLRSTWEQYFEAAGEYARTHGDLDVPCRYVTESGLGLGNWLAVQKKVRSGKETGILTDEQIARLDGIGMIWGNRFELAWERGFEHAKAYSEAYGNLLVPAKYVCDDGYRLGTWIMNMRQRRVNDRLQLGLTEDRVRRLDEIGMKWDVLSLQWEENFLEAARYYREHGDLLVSSRYRTKSGFALGAWIHDLRTARSSGSRNRRLTQEQVDRLNAIGMQWGTVEENQWERAYEAAQRYYQKNGHLRVPDKYRSPEGILLGKWIRRQRDKRSRGELSAERIRRLEEIGMHWEKSNRGKREEHAGSKSA